MNELDDLYGDRQTNEETKDPNIKVDTDMADREVNGKGDSQDGDEDEDDSDSDVEFVIATKPGQKAEPPTTKAQPYAGIKIQKPGTSQATSTAPVKKEPVAKLPDVDVDAIAEMDGKSILEVDLEALENKPWRQPGADITEYFNYGFDEFTWTAYCQKQTTLRDEYAPNKVMQNMMGAMDPGMMGAMGGGMMMPPMDPSMMSQMYSAMPMDFMQGPPGNFGVPPMPQQQQQAPPQQQQQYNRNGPAMNNGQRASNSPMPEQHARDESVSAIPNAPRGPAQSRNNFRPRGGGQGNRW